MASQDFLCLVLVNFHESTLFFGCEVAFGMLFLRILRGRILSIPFRKDLETRDKSRILLMLRSGNFEFSFRSSERNRSQDRPYSSRTRLPNTLAFLL
ncbi:hypothetical protein LEP1GSC061_1230 [Leptospira wolffii serovar Khorat str. Khorat-H2]|nr:hypothetical protein LEP1GSC061_1230 [Leptospira wolffii serovar Khorat str. Khorat-H2]